MFPITTIWMLHPTQSIFVKPETHTRPGKIVLIISHPPASGATFSAGTNNGAFRFCPVSTGVSDRIGTVCNCRSMTRFRVSLAVDR